MSEAKKRILFDKLSRISYSKKNLVSLGWPKGISFGKKKYDFFLFKRIFLMIEMYQIIILKGFIFRYQDVPQFSI